MSRFYYYRDIVDSLDNIKTGIAMGLAIKDNQLKPDEYKELCLYAKKSGFQFKDIVFST